ncbi:protein of unknown function (plasmid) [Cupriavidus taiwanensis]|nr:protein of unknown function [Cupriavidus taiwanensis]
MGHREGYSRGCDRRLSGQPCYPEGRGHFPDARGWPLAAALAMGPSWPDRPEFRHFGEPQRCPTSRLTA